jgi:hypothetical protein
LLDRNATRRHPEGTDRVTRSGDELLAEIDGAVEIEKPAATGKADPRRHY